MLTLAIAARQLHGIFAEHGVGGAAAAAVQKATLKQRCVVNTENQ